MDIKLKLYPPFVASLNKLRTKYGVEMEQINGFCNSNLNFTDFIDGFTCDKGEEPGTIDPNANASSHDIVSLLTDMTKPHTKLLGYNKLFYELTKKHGVEEAHAWLEGEWNGAFYMHDGSSVTTLPYCYAYDLEDVSRRGLFFIDKFKPAPAQHLSTFCDHVLEFVSWNANRTSGACGLPTFLYHSYYFWLKDKRAGYVLKDPETYRRQYFQKFIFDLNQPYLRVSQSAFTTLSIMDREYLVETFGDRFFPNGECAIDHIEGIIEHQKVFMEVLAEVRQECMMTFPVMSYSLLYKDGAYVDQEFARWASDHNAQWMDSNFQNDNEVGAVANCCRLRSDTTKLKGFMNSLGGSNVSIGSIKVNTINLRRISLEATKVSETQEDAEEFFLDTLRSRSLQCVKVLDTVRHIIMRNEEKGLLPNYTHGLIDLKKQFCTIGVTACYETMHDFGYIKTDPLGYETYTDEAIAFVKRIFAVIDDVKDSFTEEYSFNIENVPGENANKVLSKKDQLLFSKTAGDNGMYGNQWISLTSNCTIQEKIRLGSILDPLCSGGQIAHINICGQMNKDQHWKLLNEIASSGLKFFAFNPKISTCENNHGFFGDVCPICFGPVTDTYSRIVGYMVPTSNFSKPRKKEFNERKWFEEKSLD